MQWELCPLTTPGAEEKRRRSPQLDPQETDTLVVSRNKRPDMLHDVLAATEKLLSDTVCSPPLYG